MVAGENVAKQQCHPDLCVSGHAGAHDPHPSPAAIWAKSYPSTHNNWVIASSSKPEA